jgi:hypothetical protein
MQRGQSMCKALLLIIGCLIFMPISVIQAQEEPIIEKELIEKYPWIEEILSDIKTKAKPRPFTDFIDLGGYVDLSFGYNNNVNSNSDRNGDVFLQMSSRIQAAYTGWNELRPLIGLDTFATKYSEREDSDGYDISAFTGVDWKINPGLLWSNRIIFDKYIMPNSKNSNFYAPKFSTSIKHLLAKRLSHKFTYEWSYLDYYKRIIRTGSGQLSTDDTKRHDYRDRYAYSLRFQLDKVSFGLLSEMIFNDSNYTLEDYYDYRSFRVKPSITYFFNDKLSAKLTYGTKEKDYKNRTVSTNSNDEVCETNVSYSTAIYYDLKKNVTCGITYSYTENSSNEPTQEYSASTILGNFTYIF